MMTSLFLALNIFYVALYVTMKTMVPLKWLQWIFFIVAMFEISMYNIKCVVMNPPSSSAHLSLTELYREFQLTLLVDSHL